VGWFGTNPHAVGEALKAPALSDAFRNEFQIWPNLLPPVAGHTATNGKDSQSFLPLHSGRIVLKIQKGIKRQTGFPCELALAIRECKIQADFRIGKGRNIDRDIVLKSTLENPPALRVLV
jgi:hypothetical protein